MADAARERVLFNQCVTWAAMPETTRLKKTIDTWWPAITTFIRTRCHQRQNRGRERHLVQRRQDDGVTTRITRKVEEPVSSTICLDLSRDRHGP